jgi:signal transduction histidine kinase
MTNAGGTPMRAMKDAKDIPVATADPAGLAPGKRRYNKPFMLLLICVAFAACAYSALGLADARLGPTFFLLAVVTVVVGSRIGVQIPRIMSEITVSDTSIFLILLLYGREAAVLVAAAEAFSSSFRFNRKWSTRLFNSALLACSTFATGTVLELGFGPPAQIAGRGFGGHFLAALAVMASTQYAFNSGLAALRESFNHGRGFCEMWRSYYLWTSVTYFAGASAAGLAVRLQDAGAVYAMLVALPVVAIIYFTYRVYLQNVRAAEAHAAQAERHVEELSRYIAEQERIRAQFAQVEKLSALGVLASGVAHDFNNSLASILARAELMQKYAHDPAHIRRGLALIIKSAQDGARTVKRIQDFARQRQGGDFTPVEVDRLLADVGEITRPRWKNQAEAAGVRIELDVDAGSGSVVMGDGSELREVLVNLVFNAVDAMPQGGTLTLSTREAAGAVEIAVADTGTGMAEEVSARIFDPFFTTKGVQGMGLGLAVSYGIVARHGGRIEVESRLGVGTTFRITLPTSAIPEVNQTREKDASYAALPLGV